MQAAAILVLSFAVGAIPFTNVAARRARGVDLRRVGTGTVSGTSLYRVAGFLPMASAGILDVAKGAAGPALAMAAGHPALAAVAGGAAVVGHNWSPFLRGAGGRGISPRSARCWSSRGRAPCCCSPAWSSGKVFGETAVGALVAEVALDAGARGDARRRSARWPASAIAVPMLVKRVVGNAPAKPPRGRTYRNRILYDRDDRVACPDAVSVGDARPPPGLPRPARRSGRLRARRLDGHHRVHGAGPRDHGVTDRRRRHPRPAAPPGRDRWSARGAGGEPVGPPPHDAHDGRGPRRDDRRSSRSSAACGGSTCGRSSSRWRASCSFPRVTRRSPTLVDRDDLPLANGLVLGLVVREHPARRGARSPPSPRCPAATSSDGRSRSCSGSTPRRSSCRSPASPAPPTSPARAAADRPTDETPASGARSASHWFGRSCRRRRRSRWGSGALFSLGIVFVREVLDATDAEFGVAHRAVRRRRGRSGSPRCSARTGGDPIQRPGSASLAIGVVVAVFSLSPASVGSRSSARSAFGAAAAFTLASGMGALQSQLDGQRPRPGVRGVPRRDPGRRSASRPSAPASPASCSATCTGRCVGRLEPSRVVLLCSGLA